MPCSLRLQVWLMRQIVIWELRMARNSGSFCLGLLRAGITGVPRHASSLMAVSRGNTLLSDPPVQCGRWWVPGSWGFSVEEAHCSVPKCLVLCVVFYTFLGKICNWFICIVFLKNLASVSLRYSDEGGNTLEFRALCCHQRSIKSQK